VVLIVGSVIKNLPFHLQVYQILRESILIGRYRPGERLLELKLASELGVSRSPIREALRMLEQDGLVVTMDNGTIVNPMEVADIEEIYQCRIATEPYAGFLAATRITDEEIQELEQLVNEAEVAFNQKESERVVELNTAFHDQLVGLGGNRRLSDIVDKIRSLSILARNTELKVYSRPRDFLDEHKEIVNTLKSRNPEAVESVIRKHIENDWNYYSQQYQALKNFQRIQT
jgi:DNA-binding GntR family transcriptional regulator